MFSNPTAYAGGAVNVSAQLCALCYELPYLIRARIGGLLQVTALSIRTFRNGNSRVVVVVTDDAVYVVIRGTVFTSLKSWMVNLDFGKKQWMNGKVHAGFLQMHVQAKSFYMPIIRRQSSRDKQVLFLGHSQGGAIAYLSAVDRMRLGRVRQPVENVTFGQPRTGDRAFSRLAEKRTGGACTRVTNSRDIVVGLPSVIQGYDHFRFSFHYESGGNVVRRLQAPGAGWFNPMPSISNHSMKRYAARAQLNSGKDL